MWRSENIRNFWRKLLNFGVAEGSEFRRKGGGRAET